MAEVLAAFLQEAARQRFQFGEWDCAMLLANWVRAQTATDPASGLRGAYTTAAEWQGIAAAAGGLVALVDGLATTAGLTGVDEAEAGDIAVVEGPVGPNGAIWTGERWVSLHLRGLTAGPAKPIAIWGFR